ncbi:MAG: DUF533 domain-containing protein [Vicinamibacteria bacterium]
MNAEMLLGQLLRGGLSRGLGRGRRRNRSGSLLGGMSTGAKAQIGMGLLGVAIAAYEHYTTQNQSSSEPSPSPSSTPTATPSRLPQPVPSMPRTSMKPADSTETAKRASDATLLVQAMVAAAAADGIIDETERAQILRRSDEAGFDQETRAFLEKELGNPKSLAVIVASARPEIAVDLYAASCAAITADTEAETAYLDTLATHLKLTAETRDDIHQKLASV